VQDLLAARRQRGRVVAGRRLGRAGSCHPATPQGRSSESAVNAAVAVGKASRIPRRVLGFRERRGQARVGEAGQGVGRRARDVPPLPLLDVVVEVQVLKAAVADRDGRQRRIWSGRSRGSWRSATS
jgi:hypothetical protein